MNADFNPDQINDEILRLFTELKKEQSAEDIEYIRNLDEDSVIELHHSLGMYMRNEWGLWGDSDLSTYMRFKGCFMADDMSSVLLRLYRKYLLDEKIDIEEYFKKRWDGDPKNEIPFKDNFDPE